MSDFTCAVRGDLFARVALAVSDEATRYYLNGVQIEPRTDGPGAYLVATNGHFLIVGYDKDATTNPEASGIVRLPASLLKLCGAKPKYNAESARLEISDGRARVDGMSADDVLIDGSFPDWRRVIPSEFMASAGAGPNAFDARLIAKLGSALNPDQRDSHLVRIFAAPAKDGTPCGLSAHLVRGRCQDAFGLIMPIRHTNDAAPDWLTRPWAASNDKAAA